MWRQTRRKAATSIKQKLHSTHPHHMAVHMCTQHACLFHCCLLNGQATSCSNQTPPSCRCRHASRQQGISTHLSHSPSSCAVQEAHKPVRSQDGLGSMQLTGCDVNSSNKPTLLAPYWRKNRKPGHAYQQAGSTTSLKLCWTQSGCTAYTLSTDAGHASVTAAL
jgi:hypothetical protein